jgi:hypothetical protein
MMAGPFSAQIHPRFVSAVAERRGDDVHATIKHANRLLAKGFAVMLLLITPIAVGYGHWNELKLGPEQFVAYALMAANAYVLQQLWWTRAFAVSHNPNISLLSNLMYALLVLTLVYALTVPLGLLGTSLGMLLSAVVIYLYWRTVLSRVSG